MSSFISGGGRTYGFDIELVKSPSTSSRTSNSSSPSSAISESINSPHALSTRKPRTQRKRPNQTYNEAAALLSTVYPNIFSSKNLTKPTNHTKVLTSFADEFSEFLPPSPAFSNVEFLLHPIPHKPNLSIELKPAPNETTCQSSPISPTFDNYFQLNSSCPEEDFDAESILDEEVEEGIDSIMGNLSVDSNSTTTCNSNPSCWNQVVGLDKFDFGFGINTGVSALRHTDDVDWWRFPTVDILAISPKLNKVTCERKKKKKKKKKKLERIEGAKVAQSLLENASSNSNSNSNSNPESGIGLKLSYEKVLDAWSDRGSPFSEDILGMESSELDAIARLAQIDLFSENGGLREASVLRYREKRRSRLFSKKIRYQVRKVNADRRPRMKGRFVRRPSLALRDEKK